MRYPHYFILMLSLCTTAVRGQDSLIVGESRTLNLETLIREAISSNPALRGAKEEIALADARVRQETAFDPPELIYRRNEMPGFRWNDAKSFELEVMQHIMFPSKYSTMGELAEIGVEHATHLYDEAANELIRQLTISYADLWFFQQNIVLERENLRLLDRVRDIAKARYSVGKGEQNEILMAELLRTRSVNRLVDLRQSELGVKARLMAILNRQPGDTLGYAFIREEIRSPLPLDTLIDLGVKMRPMVMHDSMMVEEQRIARSLSGLEYYPDIKLGVGYMKGVAHEFSGWMISAGMSLPFAPWSIGSASGRIEEKEAAIRRAEAVYEGTRNMVTADIVETYQVTNGLVTSLGNFQTSLIPTAEQSLRVGLSLYENGRTEYPMVHEAYLGFIETQREYFSTRLEYEKQAAALGKAVGTTKIFQ